MRTFQVALTGDFLDPSGQVAIGDAGVSRLQSQPFIRHRFLMEQAPQPGDAEYWKRFYSLEVLGEQLAGVNGLIVLRPYLKRKALAAASDLVVIGRSGAGYDKIDVAACTEYGIALFNVPAALNHSTASAALLLMLALAKRLPQQERILRAGRWDLQPQVLGSELQGRTLGIVGLGHSGRELCRLIAPFGMRVLAYSPHADPAVAEALGVRLVSLEEALRESDFISLHCRLTEQTRGLLGPAQLALLRPTAYLVNVARGELIDQAALTEALQARRIAGAGLDVFADEPLSSEDPLLRLDNVILTPHWLASTDDVWRTTAQATAEGMLRAAEGLVPENVVNPEALDRPAFQDKLSRFTENRAEKRVDSSTP